MKGKQWILAAMAAAALVMPLSSYAAAAPQASPAAVTQKAQVPAPAYADSTLQATRYGLLQGAQEGDDFVWRGVPYGQAERWKTPENPSSWTGVRDALKTGPMGTQETAKGVKGVESCLNLDIFRPATKEQNLPVLYFIHGGNNQNGAADQVNLSQFAKRPRERTSLPSASITAWGLSATIRSRLSIMARRWRAQEITVSWMPCRALTGSRKTSQTSAAIRTISLSRASPLAAAM